MDWYVLMLRVVAIGLAAAAGWCLGRANPDWRIDRQNEDMPRHRFGYFGWGYGHGYGAAGCGYILGGFLQGAWGVGIFALGALVVAFMGWGEPLLTDTAAMHHSDGLELLFTRSFWMLLAAAIVGYAVSRLTDKGPVGPLE
jgi:hypothetical protein